MARRGQLAPPAAEDAVTSLFRAHGVSLIRLAVPASTWPPATSRTWRRVGLGLFGAILTW